MTFMIGFGKLKRSVVQASSFSVKTLLTFTKFDSYFQSWRNNLTFHGIRYDDKSFEEDPKRTEDKIREVIKIDLQMTRDIPILRAVRIKNRPMVKKTHPILGQN